MDVHEKPRVLVLYVPSKRADREDVDRKLDELELLIDTYGGEVVRRELQFRDQPHQATYVGRGKVEEVRDMVELGNIDVVILNDIVSSATVYRLEKELWEINHLIQVWDRVDLILNIFEMHASTQEAKLQIELARIKHIGPRIYGLGRSLFSRQGGGIGTRGSGETNVELEKRKITDRTAAIRKELKHLEGQKEKRLARRRDMGIGPVALVGYTSAGKTTLFNTLTGKEKEMNKGLFTTLDTVVGKIKNEYGGKPILVSDTIGFIEDLPPELIEAFRSTLMESLEAELVLHVVDGSDPEIERKIEVVEEILRDLEVETEVMLVVNKIDLLPEVIRDRIREEFVGREMMLVSAQSGEGIEELKGVIREKIVGGSTQ